MVGARWLSAAIEEGRIRTSEPDLPDWARKFLIEPLTIEEAP
jgi:hypothetical protein